jgi:hypothetical protein
LTKLDLIDEHPELYDSRRDKIKLTKIEIEQLRILTIGEKKLFASRSPRLEQLSQIDTSKHFSKHQRGKEVVTNSPDLNSLLQNWKEKGAG